jgi:GNAT superfamily N-acetyltransferase
MNLVCREIVQANHDDADRLSIVIAEAVSALPLAVWLVPDQGERDEVLLGIARLHTDAAFANGMVHATGDLTAVALWIANTPGRNPDPRYDENVAAAAGRTHAQRFRDYDRLLGAHRPTGRRYERLAVLAVRPDLHEHGISTALLARRLIVFDRNDTPAYAEAPGETSRAFYARHGFTDHGGPVDLPDGPTIYPMWRTARVRRAETTIDV